MWWQENYWDNVPLKLFKKDFKIEVRERRRKYVVEIDNYSDLVMIDPSYAGYVLGKLSCLSNG